MKEHYFQDETQDIIWLFCPLAVMTTMFLSFSHDLSKIVISTNWHGICNMRSCQQILLLRIDRCGVECVSKHEWKGVKVFIRSCQSSRARHIRFRKTQSKWCKSHIRPLIGFKHQQGLVWGSPWTGATTFISWPRHDHCVSLNVNRTSITDNIPGWYIFVLYTTRFVGRINNKNNPL